VWLALEAIGVRWVGNVWRSSVATARAQVGRQFVPPDRARATPARESDDPLAFQSRWRYTDSARDALAHCERAVRGSRYPLIGTEHILCGLLFEPRGVAARALEAFGISLEDVERKMAHLPRPMRTTAVVLEPSYSPQARRALGLAGRESVQHGQQFVGTEHLLLGLVGDRDCVAAQVLADLGAGAGDDIGSVDSAGIEISSVETVDGPGLRLRARRRPEPSGGGV
jgi:hypothetical protein